MPNTTSMIVRYRDYKNSPIYRDCKGHDYDEASKTITVTLDALHALACAIEDMIHTDYPQLALAKRLDVYQSERGDYRAAGAALGYAKAIANGAYKTVTIDYIRTSDQSDGAKAWALDLLTVAGKYMPDKVSSDFADIRTVRTEIMERVDEITGGEITDEDKVVSAVKTAIATHEIGADRLGLNITALAEEYISGKLGMMEQMERMMSRPELPDEARGAKLLTVYASDCSYIDGKMARPVIVARTKAREDMADEDVKRIVDEAAHHIPESKYNGWELEAVITNGAGAEYRLERITKNIYQVKK